MFCFVNCYYFTVLQIDDAYTAIYQLLQLNINISHRYDTMRHMTSPITNHSTHTPLTNQITILLPLPTNHPIHTYFIYHIVIQAEREREWWCMCMGMCVWRQPVLFGRQPAAAATFSINRLLAIELPARVRVRHFVIGGMYCNSIGIVRPSMQALAGCCAARLGMPCSRLYVCMPRRLSQHAVSRSERRSQQTLVVRKAWV